MTAKKQIVLLALIASALTLPSVGSSKNPITRPHRVHATATWVFGSDGWTCYHIGESTHFGRFIAEGTGAWDFSTSPPTLLWASVTTTDVQGNTALWEMPGSTYEVQFVSGTGLGKEVLACGFNTVWMSDPIAVPGGFSVDYIGEGIVTY